MLSILKVVEVIENGFADVEGFGAAGTPGEFVQALFDRLGRRMASMGPRYTSMAQALRGTRNRTEESKSKPLL